MTLSSANGGAYEVHCSEANKQALRRIQRQASLQGRGAQAIAAFREIIHRLMHDPMSAGEPHYRLPVMRIQVRSVTVRPLIVDFGVCEDRPLVFIKAVKLLSAQSS